MEDFWLAFEKTPFWKEVNLFMHPFIYYMDKMNEEMKDYVGEWSFLIPNMVISFEGGSHLTLLWYQSLILEVLSPDGELGKMFYYITRYGEEFVESLKNMIEANPQKLTELITMKNITGMFCDERKLREYLTLPETVPVQEIQNAFCSLDIMTMYSRLNIDLSFLWQVGLILQLITNYPLIIK